MFCGCIMVGILTTLLTGSMRRRFLSEMSNLQDYTANVCSSNSMGRERERDREMFYLTTHSTHFIYGFYLRLYGIRHG